MTTGVLVFGQPSCYLDRSEERKAADGLDEKELDEVGDGLEVVILLASDESFLDTDRAFN